MTGTAPGPTHTEFGEYARRGADLLRTVGARRTPGRAAMIAILLQAAPRHLSIAELEHRMHGAGWHADTSGLHRAMALFIDRALVHTLPAPGPVAYGLSHPAHHHAICTTCAAVTEIPLADLAAVAATADAALDALAFHLAPDGLALHGQCRTCATRDP